MCYCNHKEALKYNYSNDQINIPKYLTVWVSFLFLFLSLIDPIFFNMVPQETGNIVVELTLRKINAQAFQNVEIKEWEENLIIGNMVKGRQPQFREKYIKNMQ